MSVQSYLENLSSELVLSDLEKPNIVTSISTLSTRLNVYFGTDLKKHFQFGSYTRGTILPRKVDANSDIDYMVIFHNPYNYKPQTLLKYLRTFVNKYYGRSEIYQDSPTMVLELKHIKFELVPAMEQWGTIYIPAPATEYTDWMQTDPTGFNGKLTRANTISHSKVKPLVRLMKYWNRLNGNYYSSFLLENWIVNNNTYYKGSLKEYLFSSFDNLTYDYSAPQYLKNNIDRAKRIINNVRYYERHGQTYNAEMEIRKLLPDI
ncbi:SMODS domain-containing nucleotidyltransferase [Bacillus pacificus]|uniref:SMODS domain-containing nucleotidyltransferase n=1 Tax=Bacillus pacificus TaxID=2026187 RepID=UPI0037DB6A0F|nr:nucleotidyltransferase [Bacillus cereus]MCU4729682.1 nucleotidyltransferase [Bacillus cereus]MDA2607851.1 nucleotidyltransferase [Bacillus cereus]